jgi:hypothetical protein
VDILHLLHPKRVVADPVVVAEEVPEVEVTQMMDQKE